MDLLPQSSWVLCTLPRLGVRLLSQAPRYGGSPRHLSQSAPLREAYQQSRGSERPLPATARSPPFKPAAGHPGGEIRGAARRGRPPSPVPDAAAHSPVMVMVIVLAPSAFLLW